MNDRFLLTGRNSPNLEDFKIDISDTLQTLNIDVKLSYSELFHNISGNKSFLLKNYITEKLIKLLLKILQIIVI